MSEAFHNSKQLVDMKEWRIRRKSMDGMETTKQLISTWSRNKSADRDVFVYKEKKQENIYYMQIKLIRARQVRK